MGNTDIVAGDDDAGVKAEANDADVEMKNDVELGEAALGIVDSAPNEGAKGIPAPLGTPDYQS